MDQPQQHCVANLPVMGTVVQAHTHVATQIIVTRVQVKGALTQAPVVGAAAETMLLEYPFHFSPSC